MKYSTQREGQRVHSSSSPKLHTVLDVLICYQSTIAQVGLQVGFERAPQGLAQVRCRQVGPRSGQMFWGVLQKLKELFAFCLTCVLSTGFAGPGVVCQASCELLGLLCLSIVISLLLSTNFFCCLLRCSLKTLLARCSKLRVCTPRAGPGASQCPRAPATAPQHLHVCPSAREHPQGSWSCTMREPDLHDCHDKTRFNYCCCSVHYIIN